MPREDFVSMVTNQVPDGYTVSPTVPAAPTMPVAPVAAPTMPESYSGTEPISNDEFKTEVVTVPVNPNLSKDKKNNARVVVGWLVAVKGGCLGQDFHLHSDWNYIGRGDKLDVSIPDPKVSREGMVKVAYDTRSRTFAVAPCEGAANLAYLNGRALYSPMPLEAYDRIQVGDTELMLIPLCSDKFSWEE